MAGLLWGDNSYGNIPLDFSQAIVLLRISGREVYSRQVRCAGFKRLSQAHNYGNGMPDRTEPDRPLLGRKCPRNKVLLNSRTLAYIHKICSSPQ